MRRSEAARYARWSAAVALLLAGLTAGVYLKRGWQRIIDRGKAPPPAPLNVEKQSSGLTFSKMDGPRKIFTVQASKSTEFKDMEASLLENVKITIFGKTGERHDVMQTQRCQAEKGNGGITCSGEVQIDLESAADAERAARLPAAQPQIVHIETRGVHFDRATGTAKTSQPVTFTFPQGSGKAVGADYDSEEGTLRLQQNVKLKLRPSANDASKKSPAVKGPSEEVNVTGSGLDFGRDSKTIRILGPAEAVSQTVRLAAGELTLELDATFHARRLLASAGSNGQLPELTSRRGADSMLVDARQMTALFAPQGWITRLDGTGSVRATRSGGPEQDEFHTEAASLDLWPRLNQPKELNLSGGVLLKTRLAGNGNARILQTGALRINFSDGGKSQAGKPTNAETLSAGTIEWADAGGPSGAAPSRTKLGADKLQLAFGPEGKPRQLAATGNVQTEREIVGRPIQTATAKRGEAELLAAGGWSQMNLEGDVHLKETGRDAHAEKVTFHRAMQTAILIGHAVVRDATTETQAPRIQFSGTSGDFRAEGGVLSTDFSPNGSVVQFAPVPANISSNTMMGNSKAGRAVYSGHARLWQGDSVLEADSIELLRETKILNATGNVRAVFPQTAPHVAAGSSSALLKKPAIWHLSSGNLSFDDSTDVAHLQKNVIVQSAVQTIRAPRMDLYFTHGVDNSANRSNRAPAKNGGEQISRAVGTGGVIVEQGGRRATADRGEYTAPDGKFVMSGGNPTLYDGSAGTTTGLQLTFFLASDTIIVDSENGSRTLTKHRVEK